MFLCREQFKDKPLYCREMAQFLPDFSVTPQPND